MTTEIGSLTALPSFLDRQDTQPISPFDLADLDCSNYRAFTAGRYSTALLNFAAQTAITLR
jgi:hypothetical protein